MIHWNPDPDLIHLGPLRIRWYGLMFVLGFGIGYQIVRKMCARLGKPLEALDKLLIYVVAGTTIGARLGHCLFYEPGYYLSRPLEILKIWEGGLASHGGTLGVILGIWLFSRKHKDFPFLWLLDTLSIPTAMVAGFIRLGNLMNSEIIGRPTDVPWAFVFERVDKIPRHPGQLYESLCYFALFALTMTLYRLKPDRPHGFYFGIMLIWIFGWRMILETFKENQSAFEQGMFMNMGQLLSIPFVLTGIFLLVRALRSPDVPAPVPVSAAAKAPAAKRKKRR